MEDYVRNPSCECSAYKDRDTFTLQERLNNEEYWMNRAIKPNGKINRNEQGIFLTYIQIKRLLSLPITNEELKKEQKMRG